MTFLRGVVCDIGLKTSDDNEQKRGSIEVAARGLAQALVDGTVEHKWLEDNSATKN